MDPDDFVTKPDSTDPELKKELLQLLTEEYTLEHIVTQREKRRDDLLL